MNEKSYLSLRLKSFFSSKVFKLFIVISILTPFICMNGYIAYYLIKHFHQIILALVNSYHTYPHLFDSTYYMMYLYFSLLAAIGLPVIFITSLALGIIYLKKSAPNIVLLTLFMPVLFFISSVALSRIWLSFT